eukprot:1136141-Pelagomonas_calceolata.AAC.2
MPFGRRLWMGALPKSKIHAVANLAGVPQLAVSQTLVQRTAAIRKPSKQPIMGHYCREHA